MSLNKSRPTPDQLVELARQSVNPPFAPAYSQNQFHHSTISSASSHHSRTFHPGFRPASPSSPASPVSAPNTETSPATFTLLPEDIYLPFIDRPSEVASLISAPPSYKLFQLLAQTFPKSGKTSAANVEPDRLSTDPSRWAYPHLHAWLTQVDRDIAPDTLWVFKARKCILTHSELIWERVKGALGVPPELDTDIYFEAFESAGYDSGSSMNTDDTSEDEEHKARGYWEDWDAVVDSPIFYQKRRSLFPISQEDKAYYLAAIARGEGESALDMSPSGLGGFDLYDEELKNHPSISIEPLLVTSTSQATPHTEEGTGLGDIAEGAEEEEEGIDNGAPGDQKEELFVEGDPHLIHPSKIQGLKITTPLLPASGVVAALGIGSPILKSQSPLPSYPGSIGGHSRRSSIASLGSLGSGFLPRSDSFGSVKAAPYGVGLMGPAGATSRSPFYTSVIDDGPYDPVGDRSPGNPLFPSSFARLATAPTLAANNPALRHPTQPPLSRYTTHSSAVSISGTSERSSPQAGQNFSRSTQKMRTYSHGAAAGYTGIHRIVDTAPNSGTASPLSEAFSKKTRRGSEGAPGGGFVLPPFTPLKKQDGA